MKVTVGQLRKIIKEEVESAWLDTMLREGDQELLDEGWADSLKKYVAAAGLGIALLGGGAAGVKAIDASDKAVASAKAQADQAMDWVQALQAKAKDPSNTKAKELLNKLTTDAIEKGKWGGKDTSTENAYLIINNALKTNAEFAKMLTDLSQTPTQ